MAYTLYKISNLRNNKNYIGLTTNFDRRIKSHLSGAGSSLIKKDLDIYSLEDFEISILKIIEEESEAKLLEKTAISEFNCKYPNGYNKIISSSGGSKYWLGKSFPKEMRDKISESITGRKDSKETKLNKSRAGKVRYSDPIQRQLTSQRQKEVWAKRKGFLV